MKKLSKIEESVWGDIYKRGAGEQIRTEDYVISTKEELIERIQREYEKQNTAKTHILDLTMLDVSLVNDMFGLFSDDKFSDVTKIDVSNWDVSGVKDMGNMFYGCEKLQSLDVSKWNVSMVENMNGMFVGCKSLKSLDVSNWDVSNVKGMMTMFYDCRNLQTLDVSNWKVSQVEDMNCMFDTCTKLKSLDISQWDKEHQNMIIREIDYINSHFSCRL